MKISINLLPVEFTQAEVKRAKFYKIQAIGVAIVLLMIFLSSVTLALRILQSRGIGRIQFLMTQSEGKVLDLKDRQAQLLLLKNRLTIINQYLGTSSKQTAIFKLLDKLLPPSLSISSFSVDKSGDVQLTAVAPDTVTLETLITNLTTKESSEGKISQIAIESLNRGKDGFYRLSLKIKSNE